MLYLETILVQFSSQNVFETVLEEERNDVQNAADCDAQSV